MNMQIHLKLGAVLVLLLNINIHFVAAQAQGTTFTYQGRLNDGANRAAGIYDLRFTTPRVRAGNRAGPSPTSRPP